MMKRMVLIALMFAAGCTDEQTDTSEPAESATPPNETPRYEATVRWTSYGIPHIKADDWAGLGYGSGYASARDAICILAEEVMTVNGQRARYLGPGENDRNIDRDAFHQALLSGATIDRLREKMSAQMQAMTEGYVAGYNRYLADHQGELPAACNGEPWVRAIDLDDVSRITIGVGIRYGWGRIVSEITNASPPEAGPDTAALTSLPRLTPDPGRIGSNAYAIGKSLTANSRGLLLGNPHYPWQGPSRFHIKHLTIPGELDVMGAGLYTTGTTVAIGFNRHVAWSHTVSTALRFTLFKLELVDGNPLAYRWGDGQRDMEARNVTVEVLGDDGKVTSADKTVYMTHFGPVFESKETPWSTSNAWVMRDVNFENDRSAPQYRALDTATSVKDVEEALARHQGVSFVNTIATDKDGNAFYGDMSAIPYVDQDLLERCQTEKNTLRGQRVIILDGADPACQWKTSDKAAAPGLLPPEELPRLTTDSYVTNSNDSYWLSNPNQRLEGYSPIVGDERTARSLRTRAGITFIQEVIDADKKFERQTVQDIMFNHRNFGAELLLDDILGLCEGNNEAPVARACEVLTAWDRRQDVDSKGAQIYTELWEEIGEVEDLYEVPFDPAQPVSTPRGINVDNESVRKAVLDGLATATERLLAADIPIDAPWGDVQFVKRHDEKIGIPGGRGYMGMFSNIYAPLAEGEGYTPVVAGNSYIQVVTWDDAGNPDVAGILTYSQSQQPGSPHYADQTRLYSNSQWVEFPFTEKEIRKDLKETVELKAP